MKDKRVYRCDSEICLDKCIIILPLLPEEEENIRPSDCVFGEGEVFWKKIRGNKTI